MAGPITSKFRKTVFVVSTGRTGTQAIANYFDQSFVEVTAVHEPRPSRRFRVLSNRRLCGRTTDARVARSLIRSRKRLLKHIDNDIYLEANPFLHGCLPAIELAFPGAWLVHIVRDPRTYIPSHINHGVFRGLKGLAGCCFPYWLLKPDHYEASPHRRWADMAHQERLAWRWNTINGVLEQGSEIFGDRYLRIRYEDLFDAHKSGLVAMADWLQLPDTERVRAAASGSRHNASRGTSFPPFQEWDSTTQEAVMKHCGKRMSEYGYRA